MHGLRSEHLGGERRDRTADQDIELRNLGYRLDGILQADAAGEHRGESHLSVEPKAMVHGWAAQVGVDDQHAYIALGENTGEVDRYGCLAFGRRGAGEQDDLWLTARNREQQRRAQGAERLREL